MRRTHSAVCCLPSGRKIRRIKLNTTEEALLLIAAGQMAHPTVASFPTYYADNSIVSIPITDLPPSETALVWLTADRSPKIQAFARAAADVLAHTELAPYQADDTTASRKRSARRERRTILS